MSRSPPVSVATFDVLAPSGGGGSLRSVLSVRARAGSRDRRIGYGGVGVAESKKEGQEGPYEAHVKIAAFLPATQLKYSTIFKIYHDAAILNCSNASQLSVAGRRALNPG